MSQRPLVTFYGDDFTGSSAVMEVLAFAGIPTAMFMDVPSPALMARLSHIRAFGIAGIARAQSPDWMDSHLPRYFAALKALNAPILHYKTCSTFDSSPRLGSIGRATEIGLTQTGATWAPLIVGAPAIGRYQMFGTLFAAFDGVVHRLDRHPVMACHPATPMHEADLCRHLAQQTHLPCGIIDWRAIAAGKGSAAIAQAKENGQRVLALDVYDEVGLGEVGRLIWEAAQAEPLFAVGSQGVEYALTAHWRKTGLLPNEVAIPALAPAHPLLVVSGSCSSITARQIAAAEQAGFVVLELDAGFAIEEQIWQQALDHIGATMITHLNEGRNVLVCTARGPDDPAVARLNLALEGRDSGEVHTRIGSGLGALVRRARVMSVIRRAIISGGDTSGQATLALGAEALLPICPIAPGVPLLEIRASDPVFDGMEIALKGGQMGGEDLFIRANLGG